MKTFDTCEWLECSACRKERPAQLGVLSEHRVFNQARFDFYGPGMAMTVCPGSNHPGRPAEEVLYVEPA